MGLFSGQFSRRTRIRLKINGDLKVRDDLDKNSVAKAIYILIFFRSFFFQKTDTRQNESH